jgi:Tol biopolymer transport system component
LKYIRGRNDWSIDDLIITYAGLSWDRNIFIMRKDGSEMRQLTQGGNSQGPSFSPDGQWIAFTAYFDKMNNPDGCDIYIMTKDGNDMTRLTNNNYCDWQPRWGP